MPEWVSALICLAIVIVAILITSLVKVIMQKAAKRKGGELDCKKWEYLFAAISLLLSGVGVFCFLKFYLKVTDINVLVKTTAMYAGSVQTVYLFGVQLVRKGWKGMILGVKKLFVDLKKSEKPIEELPEIISNETKTKESDDIERLKSDFEKIINKK